MDYALIAYLTLGFGVVMYVILDGFDLGLGILFPFAGNARHRDVMIASVASVWDGNETWLVLGGAVLFAAFPAAYGILLSAWYLPLILMLCALVLRGVAFEYRAEARWKGLWSVSFSVGSTFAAFCQGVMLGSFVHGLQVSGHRYAGGPWDWLTPFSLMTGVAVVAGYALLGTGWLILKTEGALQAWSYRIARPLTLVLLFFLALVSVWTPLSQPAIAARWFSVPQIAYLAPLPAATAVASVLLWRSLGQRRVLAPFMLCVVLFLLTLLGFAYSLWPYIVPRALTIEEAASPPVTLRFILLGVLVLMPLMLAYTWHTYRLFRGKVSGAGYG
ncbi:MAG: cytochrome d ubiquinol oxidase subunit II [Thiobacillus sp.]